jgi:hypothetical protein
MGIIIIRVLGCQLRRNGAFHGRINMREQWGTAYIDLQPDSRLAPADENDYYSSRRGEPLFRKSAPSDVSTA